MWLPNWGYPDFAKLQFNLIAGAPGGGKTTLAHQIMFANASPERPALYFTVLGEPALKMLRYQQQFMFFDQAALNTSVRFINLSQIVLERDLGAVLDEIIREVEAASPGLVVVDSFRTVVRKGGDETGGVELQGFVQRLALHLTSWQATTFLIGEYNEGEMQRQPRLHASPTGSSGSTQQVERNSIVRKLQVVKLRGQASVPGLHTFRITDAGLQAYPRTFGLTGKEENDQGPAAPLVRHPRAGRDDWAAASPRGQRPGGGPVGVGQVAPGDPVPRRGTEAGEPGIVAIFEERPEEYVERAAAFGIDLDTPREHAKLEILYLRPLDLSVDETVREIIDAVQRVGAKRLVIDSLAGFEMALAPGFRADFRESLYRMIGALTRIGVTIVSTVEVQETFTGFGLSSYAISFLSDDIIRLRYVSIDGQLRKMLVVVKMRRGDAQQRHARVRDYVRGIRHRRATPGLPWPDHRGSRAVEH